MHLLMFSADRALADPGSPAFRRHARYAEALAARRPGSFIQVVVPGAAAHRSGALAVLARVPQGRFDAVTAQNPWSGLAWRHSLARRIPFLAQLHFDPFAPPRTPGDALRQAVARLAARHAARVRVMAHATAGEAERRWGVPAERLWVAPVPIGLPAAGRVARQALVVGAMRLAADRAPEQWLKAAARIASARPDTRFVLAGEGPLRPRLHAEARAAGLAIELPGRLAPDALAGLLAGAALFLHTAPNEAFGRAMLEAQAAGVPVVARATTGAAEIVADRVSGMLVASAQAAASAAILLLENPDRAALMGEAARQRAAARFDPAEMQARVVDFLLGERGGAGAPCATC